MCQASTQTSTAVQAHPVVVFVLGEHDEPQLVKALFNALVDEESIALTVHIETKVALQNKLLILVSSITLMLA